MLDIRTETDGASFAVQVAPRASREGLAGVHDGALKVRLTAPPVEGAANAALVRLVAKLLGVPKGAVRVAAGRRSRRKRLLVEGLAPAEVARRLKA
jgi:hypothetical protein